MFRSLSTHIRKATHGIIIYPWNVILFMANLFIHLFVCLFKCSLHVFTKNGMIRKISKTKVWPGIARCFITLTAMRNFIEISYKVYNLFIGIMHFL